jgi:predicted DNA-binding ribbon-helix-helix protein
MNSPVIKHSIVIGGHKTSISLEEAFWKALKEIARARKMTLTDLATAIDDQRDHHNLSSCLRLFVLEFYRHQLEIRVDGRGRDSALSSGPVKSATATTAT